VQSLEAISKPSIRFKIKSKIPDFERERIDGDNHSNPAYGGISRIGHLDPTQRLDLRGGFEIASTIIALKSSVLVDVAVDQRGCFEISTPTSHSGLIYTIDRIFQ